MLEIFNKGGVVMYPLLLLSIIAIGVAIERLYFLSKVKMNTKEFVEKIFLALSNNLVSEALQICETYTGAIARMLKAGLKKHQKGREEVEKAIASSGSLEVAKMERGLSLLQSVAAISPLIGFLGTVIGMIKSFESMGETGNASLVAIGISEALITTAAGLSVAIPASFLKNYFGNKINNYVYEMEESSLNFLNALEDLEEKIAQRSSQAAAIGGEYLET
jgi:biopolymer transport protein ExbB